MKYAPRTQSSPIVSDWGKPAGSGYGVASGGSSSSITVNLSLIHI